MKKSSKKVPKKKKQEFHCEYCDYTTSKKSQWERHISTAKHFRLTQAYTGLQKKFQGDFLCENCKKTFNHRQSLFRHKKICKKGHRQLAKISQKLAKISHPKFVCECGKSYKHASSFSKHKSKCIHLHNEEEEQTILNDIVPNNNVEILLKAILQENQNIAHENKVLRDKLSNLEMNVTNITNNNTNNNQFNINMFLNDKCKNAMNLTDFIEKIQLTLEDLKYTSENGYTSGISNIFIKNLNDMDVTERPIHCSDEKRLQFYIKNENEWTKDKNNEKIDNSIEQLSKKQIETIKEWTEQNPNFMDCDQKREEYFKMVNETMQPNDDKNLRNIKKKLGFQVKIEK